MEHVIPLCKTLRARVLGAVLLVTVSLAFGGFLVRAVAQAEPEAAPCGSESTTAAMRNCENLRYARAEKALDSAYAELLKQLDETGKAKLRSAQSAWLQFRQAEVDFEADTARGGTLAPLLKITAMANLTEARARELKKSLRP